ncbi:universal stress protein [Amycolatopsis cynarae]|uniref:Universal stress protein n=1 Tax=Amycolatopsis cynarae TaxID=2995223 RepID=A0ABY7ATH6_9PSEU|nr:universal stress protein [Amycolatopsis sp. HUAS 11-8]WAL63266.1 universal stress protein [Amycolatopsis sp. HUAS 11-8]
MAAEGSTGPRGPIVVGVDGSQTSVAALRWAMAEAGPTGREVVAVTAWTHPPPGESGAPADPVEEVAAAHRRDLDALVRKTARPGVAVRAEAVEGEAKDVLLDRARGASLLVLGSHGHGMMLRALVGSVCGYCLHHATCPVVIVPARPGDPDAGAGPALATAEYLPGSIV